jgi:hypothetical protein
MSSGVALTSMRKEAVALAQDLRIVDQLSVIPRVLVRVIEDIRGAVKRLEEEEEAQDEEEARLVRIP